MFSQCLKCGYIAEPQDIFCVVCSDLSAPSSTWVRMTRIVGNK